jgi:hypothetical protein
MNVERVQIVNYGAFGEKVKAWAKGLEPIPANLDEFKAQMTEASVGCSIPDSYKNVRFVQEDVETIVIRLPTKSLLEAMEAELATRQADYQLPEFYERLFQARPQMTDKLELQAERIGDYTISMCM